MASKRKKTYIIGIAVALVLPLFTLIIFTYYYLKHGAPKLKLPSYYGILHIDTMKAGNGLVSYDTIYKIVGDVHLINQVGKSVDLNQNLRGKILVINFFDTRDSTVSTVLAKNLHDLEERFQSKAAEKPNQDDLSKLFQIVSISLDPNHDGISQIRSFADKYNAHSEHWWLLTGDSTAIYNYAINQLDMPLKGSKFDRKSILNKIILVDTFRFIRGYYNGLKTDQMVHLANDISLITMQKSNYERK